jgi:hypothetical protein
MNWQIHPAAQQELEDCLEWFAHIDPELSLAFAERYLQARHAICAKRRPHYWRTRLAGMKKPS